MGWANCAGSAVNAMSYLLLYGFQAQLQEFFELFDEELKYKRLVRDEQAQPLSIIKQLFTGNVAQMTFMLEHWQAKYQDRIYSVHFDGGSQRSGRDIYVAMDRAACIFFLIDCVLCLWIQPGEQRAWIRCSRHDSCFKYRQVHLFSSKKACATWLCAWGLCGEDLARCPTQHQHKKNPSDPDVVQQFLQ